MRPQGRGNPTTMGVYFFLLTMCDIPQTLRVRFLCNMKYRKPENPWKLGHSFNRQLRSTILAHPNTQYNVQQLGLIWISALGDRPSDSPTTKVVERRMSKCKVPTEINFNYAPSIYGHHVLPNILLYFLWSMATVTVIIGTIATKIYLTNFRSGPLVISLFFFGDLNLLPISISNDHNLPIVRQYCRPS